MNPGDSKTAPLPPQHGDEPLPNQQEKAQLQKPTYPQSNSYTTQTVGGSILIGNPGSVLRGNQQIAILLMDKSCCRDAMCRISAAATVIRVTIAFLA